MHSSGPGETQVCSRTNQPRVATAIKYRTHCINHRPQHRPSPTNAAALHMSFAYLLIEIRDVCSRVFFLFFCHFFFAHFYISSTAGQAVVTGVVPSSPRFLPSFFIAHRVQQSHCSSIFHRVLLTHALALSASQVVHKKKSLRNYTSSVHALGGTRTHEN